MWQYVAKALINQTSKKQSYNPDLPASATQTMVTPSAIPKYAAWNRTRRVPGYACRHEVFETTSCESSEIQNRWRRTYQPHEKVKMPTKSAFLGQHLYPREMVHFLCVKVTWTRRSHRGNSNVHVCAPVQGAGALWPRSCTRAPAKYCVDRWRRCKRQSTCCR